MSKYGTPDPDSYVLCPFNDTHQVPASRLQRHIMRCEKQHAHLNLKHCPFNFCHLKPPSEMRQHMANCPDRAIVEKDIFSRGNEKDNKKRGHFAKIEINDDWDDDDKFEDWDKEDEVKNTAPTAYDRARQKESTSRLPRSQPKVLQREFQKWDNPKGVAENGVPKGRGRGVWRYEDIPAQDDAVEHPRQVQNGFLQNNWGVIETSQMEQTMKSFGALPDGDHKSIGESDRISTSSGHSSSSSSSGRFRGRGRARRQVGIEAPTPGSQFAREGNSLLASVGRGRGRGLIIPDAIPASLQQSEEERNRKELKKMQKKMRGIEDLEARQFRGEKLNQEEIEKIERKNYVLEQIETLSISFEEWE